MNSDKGDVLADLIRNMGGGETCRHCKDEGVVESRVMLPGWKANHNRAVRSYSGGPRPHAYRDQSITTWRSCTKCELGREHQLEYEDD